MRLVPSLWEFSLIVAMKPGKFWADERKRATATLPTLLSDARSAGGKTGDGGRDG